MDREEWEAFQKSKEEYENHPFVQQQARVERYMRDMAKAFVYVLDKERAACDNSLRHYSKTQQWEIYTGNFYIADLDTKGEEVYFRAVTPAHASCCSDDYQGHSFPIHYLWTMGAMEADSEARIAKYKEEKEKARLEQEERDKEFRRKQLEKLKEEFEGGS